MKTTKPQNCKGEGKTAFQFTLPPYTLPVLNNGRINQTIAVERSSPNAVNSKTRTGCPRHPDPAL